MNFRPIRQLAPRGGNLNNMQSVGDAGTMASLKSGLPGQLAGLGASAAGPMGSGMLTTSAVNLGSSFIPQVAGIGGDVNKSELSARGYLNPETRMHNHGFQEGYDAYKVNQSTKGILGQAANAASNLPYAARAMFQPKDTLDQSVARQTRLNNNTQDQYTDQYTNRIIDRGIDIAGNPEKAKTYYGDILNQQVNQEVPTTVAPPVGSPGTATQTPIV